MLSVRTSGLKTHTRTHILKILFKMRAVDFILRTENSSHCPLRTYEAYFFSSIAIVMGPTPPGTGVMNDVFGGDMLEIHIADQFPGHAVDPDIDHDRPLLHHVCRDKAGPADRGNQNVCLRADLREIRRFGMADRDGRIGIEQQKRHGPPDDIAPSDHDGALSANPDPAPPKQFHHAERRTGNRPFFL